MTHQKHHTITRNCIAAERLLATTLSIIIEQRMKKIRVILNGKGASSSQVRAAVNKIREHEGQPLEVRTTWEGGDATRFAREAVADNVDILVAGGGDGTIHEVLNGIMSSSESSRISLAILPLGTANDFAHANHVPLEPYDALKLAVEGTSVKVDVGVANGVYFMNVASGGFGAEVTVSTPTDLKKRLGGGAYALTGAVTAAKMKPYDGTITCDDGATAQGKFIAMAVGNGCQAGGGLKLLPGALLDDGLIDVMFLSDFDPLDMGPVALELANYADTKNKFVHYRQIKSCDIQLTKSLPVNLDGEPYSWDRIHFEVKPKCLSMILPNNDPLLLSTSST